MFFDGRDITRRRPRSAFAPGIGYVPQEHSVFARLSVRDNLAVGSLSNTDPARVDRVLAIFPKLGQRLDQPAGTLSGGERKMLAIGARDAGRSRIAAAGRADRRRVDRRDRGDHRAADRAGQEIAVVIVEQHLDLALRVADYAYVLDRGRVALQGAAGEVRSDPELLRYLAP